MNYYELQPDGSVGRFTTSLKVAEANNLKNFTNEEILSLENKYYLKSKYDEIIESEEYKERQKQKQKEQRRQELLNLLDKLDLKSIRAIRANDTEYINKYEEEAEALREELRNL